MHTNLAVPHIYGPLGWTEKKVEPSLLEHLDMNEGVDYIFLNKEGLEIKIQERFRDQNYKKYNDCTLRYKRDANPDIKRHASEFFKIKADYLVYGITNGAKFIEKRHTLTDFEKFVVLDLKGLFQQIDSGLIIPKQGPSLSYIENQKLIAPIKDNVDSSSSFVAFDVNKLHYLFGRHQLIINQKGFY